MQKEWRGCLVLRKKVRDASLGFRLRRTTKDGEAAGSLGIFVVALRIDQNADGSYHGRAVVRRVCTVTITIFVPLSQRANRQVLG